jgi:hypothetical protein
VAHLANSHQDCGAMLAAEPDGHSSDQIRTLAWPLASDLTDAVLETNRENLDKAE